MTSRICTRCRRAKDPSDFCRIKASSDGLNSICRVCARELYGLWLVKNYDHKRVKDATYRSTHRNERQAYYQQHRRRFLDAAKATYQAANAAKIQARQQEIAYVLSRTEKRCAACCIVKLLSEYYRATSSRDGRGSWCKQCSAVSRLRSDRKRQATRRAQRKRNPRPNRHAAKRRRAFRLRVLVNDFTADQWLALLEAYSRRCAYCGIAGVLTEDHLVPLSRGGDHTLTNIVPACQSCNSSKHTKTALEYFCRKLMLQAA